MFTHVVEVIGECPLALAASIQAALQAAEAMGHCRVAGPRPPLPAPTPAMKGVTISIECWRDADGKLHCKLSITFGQTA